MIRDALLWSPSPPIPESTHPPGYEPKPESAPLTLSEAVHEDLERRRQLGEQMAIEMIGLAVRFDGDLPRRLRNAAREIGADPSTATCSIEAIRHLVRQRRELLLGRDANSPLHGQLTERDFAWIGYQDDAALLRRLPPLELIARYWERLVGG